MFKSACDVFQGRKTGAVTCVERCLVRHATFADTCWYTRERNHSAALCVRKASTGREIWWLMCCPDTQTNIKCFRIILKFLLIANHCSVLCMVVFDWTTFFQHWLTTSTNYTITGYIRAVSPLPSVPEVHQH